MSEPNPDDPLMPDIADQLRYQKDKVRVLVSESYTVSFNLLNQTLFQFNTTAKDWTEKHAFQSQDKENKVKRLKVN